MSDMFSWDPSLETVDLRGWDTSNVTDMSSMFHRTESLSVLDVGNWDTSKVTVMAGSERIKRD